MNEITKNIRTHICYIKTMDGRDIEEVHITKTQYELITHDISNLKANDFYIISDVDNGRILFEGQKRDIVRIKEKNIGYDNGYIGICSLGERHSIIDGKFECDCIEKMGINPMDIISSLNMLGYNIFNTKDITKEMRQKLYIEIRKDLFNEKLKEYKIKVRREWIKFKQEKDLLYGRNINI